MWNCPSVATVEASNEVFTGRIDEVRVYNVALAQSAIQKDMNSPLGTASQAVSAAPLATQPVAATPTEPTDQMVTPAFIPTSTASPTVAPISASTETTNDLVLGLGFEEGTGSTTADSSIYHNNGTLVNGPLWTTQGKFGNAIQFDGIDDRVSVDDAVSLDVTTGLTIEAWVYPTKLNNWSTIVMKELPSSFAYVLYGWWFGADAAAGTNSGGERVTSGGGMLPLNTWTHVAMTYNGAQQILYFNGQAVASNDYTGALTTTSLPLSIGGNNQESNEVFTGSIDEVRVYNGALSQTDIQRDMNAPVVQAADTQSPNPSETVTETLTPELTETLDMAVTETLSPSPEQTETLDAESTETLAPPAESTETVSPETTELADVTDIPTPTPTDTSTGTPTPSETPTLTPTLTETATPELTEEPTYTPTPTETTTEG